MAEKHPEVKRTALIQTKEKGQETASIVIERTDKKRLRGIKREIHLPSDSTFGY